MFWFYFSINCILNLQSDYFLSCIKTKIQHTFVDFPDYVSWKIFSENLHMKYVTR